MAWNQPGGDNKDPGEEKQNNADLDNFFKKCHCVRILNPIIQEIPYKKM